ncbi:hypothetical protein [Nonomuraea maheshkhaliensis]|uniref:hypothetical protein n=1 Tax=Nonomuraea maheshkhaliensis TaxID=419590 RepID=UPI0031F856EB
MGMAKASADEWRNHVRACGSVERDREALARLIEYNGDPFEIELTGARSGIRAG